MALSLNNRHFFAIAGSVITSSLFLSWSYHRKSNLISKDLESKLKSIIEGINTRSSTPLQEKVERQPGSSQAMSRVLAAAIPFSNSARLDKEKVPLVLPSLKLEIDTEGGTSALPLHFAMSFDHTISNEQMAVAAEIFRLPRGLYSEKGFDQCCLLLNQLALDHGYSETLWTPSFNPKKMAKSYLSIPNTAAAKSMLISLGLPIGTNRGNNKLIIKHPLELKSIFNLAQLAPVSTTVQNSATFKYLLLPKIDMEVLKNALKERLGAESFNDRKNGLAFEVRGSKKNFAEDVQDLINKLISYQGESSLTDIDARTIEKVVNGSLTISRSNSILSVQLGSHFTLLFLAGCLL